MNGDKVFVDTNIFVYAKSESEQNTEKHCMKPVISCVLAICMAFFAMNAAACNLSGYRTN